MIVEPIVAVILHCSRCNTPWIDPETETPTWWSGLVQIAETFQRAGGDVAGWRRTCERYLCEGCHIVDDGLVVEKPPLSGIEQAKVGRAHALYAQLVGRVAAYELLPTAPEVRHGGA